MRTNKARIYETLIARDGLNCGICGGSLEEGYRQYKAWRSHISKPNKIRGSIDFTIDHIYPKSKLRGIGRWEDLQNLQLAHKTCNNDKGNKETPPKESLSKN